MKCLVKKIGVTYKSFFNPDSLTWIKDNLFIKENLIFGVFKKLHFD